MQHRIMYIELKSGFGDNGPAWIGKVLLSKSGKTVYFNNKAFERQQGISGNHYDIETDEEYWLSGVKKNGQDRHWAGGGKIFIDKKVINEYLEITGLGSIDKSKFEIVDIIDEYPIERIMEVKNKKLTL